MSHETFATDGVEQVDERRHILVGDLEWLEFAIADYVAKWCTNWTGVPYEGEFGANIAGMPTAVANAAMTVIRKNIVASFTETVTMDMAAVDREIRSKAAGWPHRADQVPLDGCSCRECNDARDDAVLPAVEKIPHRQIEGDNEDG